MKQKLLQKTLLLLFALIAGSTSAWADNFNYNFSTGGTHNSSDNPVTNTWVTSYFTILQEKNTSTSAVANYLTAPRWYKSHKITITPAAGVTITQITINCGETNTGQDITASTGSVSKDGNNSTWTGSITSTSPLVLIMGSQCRPSSLDITYTSAVAVLAPTFSPNGGEVEKGTSVVISTTTDGASIYYTTNGDAPTSSSTLYEGPLTINSAQTIKAIAIKGSDASSVTTATYTIKKVDTPTFSVAAGAVLEGTTIELATTTDGATIHYTTDGSNPTASSPTYSSAIEINADMTIKAIAVKTNWDDSDVASATYTVLTPINGLSVDFEANDVSRYADWEFTNIGTHTTTISAHGGSYYGSNVNSSDNGVSTASIKTKNKIEHPGSITFYISKESKNTTESSWYVEVSENGSTWTQVGDTQDAKSMNKGSWIEVSRNLSSYANVYVRIRYDGSNAIRAIDDITLTDAVTITLASACTDGEGKYYGTYSNSKAFVVPADLTVSEVSVIDGELWVEEYDEGDIVPANTGVMVSSDVAGDHTITLATGGTSVLGDDNMLKASGDAGITAADMTVADTKFYRLTMHNGTTIGFWWGAENGAAFDLAANKAYLAVPDGALTREGLWFGDETAINALENATKVDNGAIYDLSGRRVENPTKGIYIMNGKKVVIR